MLIIKIKDEVLTFDLRELRWVGSDEVLASVLNGMIPTDEIDNPAIVFADKGIEAVVLEHLKEIWPELEVVAFKPEPPPEREPGVIY